MYLLRIYFSFFGLIGTKRFLEVQLYALMAIVTCIVILKHYTLLPGFYPLSTTDDIKAWSSLIFGLLAVYIYAISIIKRIRTLEMSSKFYILIIFPVLNIFFLSNEKIASTGTKEDREFRGYMKNKASASEKDKNALFVIEIMCIIIIVTFIRTFLFTPFQIYGPSMKEGYQDSEFITINKFAYADLIVGHASTPDRGDVVVFTPGVDEQKKFLIKRVIGLPGDQIKIQNGYVHIQTSGSEEFVQISEPYLSETNTGNTCVRTCSTAEKEREYITEIIPEGKYYLLGDNRVQSLDSRACFENCNNTQYAQFVDINQLHGKVSMSIGKFKIFESILPIKMVKPYFEVTPRFFSIPNDLDYPELNN